MHNIMRKVSCSQITTTDFSKVWVAKVRARTHMCDVRSHVCVRNPFWKVCGMCVRAALFLTCDVRPHFCTLFGTKLPENATFCLKNYSRTRMSYPVLEHLFLLWNILSCFRTSYSDLEHLILFLNTKKTMKIMKSCWKKFEKLLKTLF